MPIDQNALNQVARYFRGRGSWSPRQQEVYANLRDDYRYFVQVVADLPFGVASAVYEAPRFTGKLDGEFLDQCLERLWWEVTSLRSEIVRLHDVVPSGALSDDEQDACWTAAKAGGVVLPAPGLRVSVYTYRKSWLPARAQLESAWVEYASGRSRRPSLERWCRLAYVQHRLQLVSALIDALA